MEFYSIRLHPGNDLKHSLDAFATDKKLDAAAIVTCVGSLTVATIRFAGKEQTDSVPGPLEITSLTGTFSKEGSHFHITVTDQDGKASGGHLKEGSIVRTTAEIVILDPGNVFYKREKDEQTGYNELVIVPK
ncbi:MAG TPA: DNA-binding protein [Bacteroidia bacterium]|nr:DNA-binding protein [Bacteroidia bacterium]HNP97691.1 DNA-binding protein [Bacteroidia bacterium]